MVRRAPPLPGRRTITKHKGINGTSNSRPVIKKPNPIDARSKRTILSAMVVTVVMLAMVVRERLFETREKHY